MEKPLHVFCCYARADQSYLLELRKRLIPLQREGLIAIHTDIDVSPGEEWEPKIQQYLNTAHVILLLVSPDFIASDYCYSNEMKRALERHKEGKVLVIPILLRAVDLHRLPFGSIQCLPTDAKPIKSWADVDDAFLDVTNGIIEAIEKFFPQSVKQTSSQQRPKSTPKNIRVTSSPSREGNKAIILFDLNGTEHALEYIRYDKITRQTLFLKEKQQELVRLEVPSATLKPVEKQATFHIDGVDGLLTFKMSAVTGIMNISVKLGEVEIFHN